MTTQRETGQLGEDAAVAALCRAGYRILARNYRAAPFGEIDVIAEEGGFLVFIEVKTRTGLQRGLPREAVDRRKQQRLIRAAYRYLSTLPDERPCRFDVAEVLLRGGRVVEVHLIRHAFAPDPKKDLSW